MSENTNNNDQLQNKEQNPTGTEYNRRQANKRTKVQIEIVKWSRLIDMLSDNRKVARTMVVVALLLIIVFVGVSAVALVLKRFYPYNVISTNPYGAAIIKNEDTEVVYWLFNTAELWANSGIKVEEGDIVTIRASGAVNTAIHHVVSAAENNEVLNDKYASPIGGVPAGRKDEARVTQRIVSSATWGELLMQVIPEDKQKMGDAYNWYHTTQYDKHSSPDILDGHDGDADIYVVGKERQEIRIRKSGILHFTVNDIVLTDRVLEAMLRDGKLKKEANNIKDIGIYNTGITQINHKDPIFRDGRNNCCSYDKRKAYEKIRNDYK